MARKLSKVDAAGIPLRKEVVIDKFPPSRTIKSHAQGLTVNEIMKRYSVTGTIPDRGVPPQFLDTSIAPSMFDALNLRVSLNKYFGGLDAVTRAKFSNDPMKLVQFVNDPKNVNSGVEMGLLKLNEGGLKAKADWDAKQAKLAADKRTAFEASVRDVLKADSSSAQPK